jgi:hypothetical protein
MSGVEKNRRPARHTGRREKLDGLGERTARDQLDQKNEDGGEKDGDRHRARRP